MMATALQRSKLVRTIRGAFRAYQPLRFIIVGGFNTGLCYLVYASLVWAGLVFWAANFGALLFGIGLSFLTQGRIVFGNSDPKRFWRFFASWLVIYVVQTGAIELLMRRGLSPTWAGLVVLPGTAVASYLIQKWLVFHKPGSVE